MRRRSRIEARQLERWDEREVVEAYSRWTSLSDAEVNALRWVLNTQRRVLDLGSGTGRIAKFVASNVSRYTGIDRSEMMVRRAREMLPGVHFEQRDFFDITPGDSDFNAVLIMHNTIDSIHPNSRRLGLLRCVGTWLPKGGILVLSSHVPSNVTPGRPGHILRVRSWSRRRFVFIRGQGYVPEDYHGRTVWQYRTTPLVMVQQLDKCGFDVVECHLDWSRRPFDWIYYVALRRLVGRWPPSQGTVTLTS